MEYTSTFLCTLVDATEDALIPQCSGCDRLVGHLLDDVPRLFPDEWDAWNSKR